MLDGGAHTVYKGRAAKLERRAPQFRTAVSNWMNQRGF